MAEEKDELGSTEHVECSSCTGRKRKAEKTCLQCLASYCGNHLDMHNALHANAKRHKLVEATGRLEERICPEHDRLVEVFCRTDKQCICHMCMNQNHRTHDVVSIDCEVAEVKLKLAKTRKEITDRIKSREGDVQALQQAIEHFQASAGQAVEENEKSFTELIHSIELRQGEVKKLILDQEEEAVKKATELLKRLPSEITDLKRRDVELQHLERLSREDNDAMRLTLDTNTVHNYLQLSNMNKELTAAHTSANYPSHPDRFERRMQALCREGLRGSPRYWEVECGTKGSWITIAVSYKEIKRKGKQAPLFGRCKRSWALRTYGDIYQFWHDNKWQKPQPDRSLDCTRIGIYLDHGAGILAFYNVSGNFSLIFKVQTKFTEPVYAGFGLVGTGSHIRLRDV